MTIQIEETVLQKANKRSDALGRKISGRLESCNDLAVEETVYHSTCMSKFLKKSNSNEFGRPRRTKNTFILQNFQVSH